MLGALFVLIAEPNANIVGIRLSTAAPNIQSKGILVGVANDPAVQTLPSSSARSAIIEYVFSLFYFIRHTRNQINNNKQLRRRLCDPSLCGKDCSRLSLFSAS